MKKILSISMLFILPITQVHANEYIKRNGSLSLSQKNNAAEFNINAFHGNSSDVCSMVGIAESVGAGSRQNNRWVFNDSSSACLAVISELKDGSVNVTTRACESYCGVSAVGSMDGQYMMK